MPHIIIEYTENLGAEARIADLLARVNAVMIAQKDEAGKAVYPIGGIRSRAIALDEYCIADGADDYAFVHATVKIGAGRSEAVEKRTTDELFAAMQAHFAEIFASRYLALSLELFRFSEAGTYKQNNIHAKFRVDARKGSDVLS
jgi:5-carboxymethyl-2-hydroxymuconate isomerase